MGVTIFSLKIASSFIALCALCQAVLINAKGDGKFYRGVGMCFSVSAFLFMAFLFVAVINFVWLS